MRTRLINTVVNRNPTLVTQRSRGFAKGVAEMLESRYSRAQFIKSRGAAVISNSLTNKTLAFDQQERDRLGLRGLLPNAVLTLEQQAEVKLKEFEKCSTEANLFTLEQEIMDAGIRPEMVAKWKMLQRLQDTDETLFYHLL